MPKINIEEIPAIRGVGYPAEFQAQCVGRSVKKLGDTGGLTQFGAHLVTLPPNTWASQRHWHSAEDEFVYILSGTPTLIDDDGETQLQPGDACTHKAGDGNGHHVVNNSNEDATLLVVGTRNKENDSCYYPDVDLELPANGTDNRVPYHKEGTPY